MEETNLVLFFNHNIFIIVILIANYCRLPLSNSVLKADLDSLINRLNLKVNRFELIIESVK